jgi:DNA-binding transcriptional LysR family regulator
MEGFAMKAEWLEDIVALFEARSINGAAEARFLTQPAFSRRIAAIEEHLGVELVDRSKRPAILHKAVQDQETRIRDIVHATRELVLELRNQSRKDHKQVVIGSQHAITTSVAPTLIKHLIGAVDAEYRLRSGDRDECAAMLLTKQSDLAVIYRARYEKSAHIEVEYVQERAIGEERFIPVVAIQAAAAVREAYARGELPIIAYPMNVFMGHVMAREIYPLLPKLLVLRRKTETAFTLASLQMALAGVGVAWLPSSLAQSDLDLGRIVSLEDILPTTLFTIVVQRLLGKKTDLENEIWRALASRAPFGRAPKS